MTVVPLRWSDQDINGHVNNAKVVTAIEEARILWLNKLATKEGLSTFKVPKVVVSLEVEYQSSVTADQDLTIYIATERLGTSSFTLQYRGEQEDKSVFTARTVLVMLDKKSLLPRPLGAEEREYLSRYPVKALP